MAPLPELVTPLGHALLAQLPPFLREDPDTVAVMHCCAKEVERMDLSVADARAQMNPLTAGTWGLTAWEGVLRIAHDESADLEQQREAVLRRYRSIDNDPSGVSWQARVNRRLGEIPWTYEEHVPGDAGTPPAQVLRFTLPYEVGPQLTEALRILREEVPSELGITVIGSGGFILDQSQMDIDVLGI